VPGPFPILIDENVHGPVIHEDAPLLGEAGSLHPGADTYSL
jgi:hypothetical protein